LNDGREAASQTDAHRPAIDFGAYAFQHVPRQGALRLLEELALLAPDVRGESRTAAGGACSTSGEAATARWSVRNWSSS
jgi:hypothetical protein